ncbi:hypothetical protein PRUB_a1516 [Pseudoalteromonas rubra]|uniref:Uncharacterized protein n=1 Tax=Pseudoalteromonas rubra TaxID=43658 RepID=A0A8T0CDU2_9GAMM|nr:hypothetical protein PRUB_a1516 [Pseudoalteromonas rubra]
MWLFALISSNYEVFFGFSSLLRKGALKHDFSLYFRLV